MPRQWLLTTLYMIFIYGVFVAIIEYTKRHPIVDEPQQTMENISENETE